MSARAARRLAQQEKVLTLTAELLLTSGADAFRMATLANVMKVSTGGLYRYFPSKEAIFCALQIRALESLRKTIKDIVETHVQTHSDPNWSLVHELFDAWTTFEQKDPMMANALNQFAERSAALLSPEEQDLVGQKVFEVIDTLAETLEMLQSEGVISEGIAKLRAFNLWAMVFGFLQLRRRQQNGMKTLPLTSIRDSYLSDLKRSWTVAS